MCRRLEFKWELGWKFIKWSLSVPDIQHLEHHTVWLDIPAIRCHSVKQTWQMWFTGISELNPGDILFWPRRKLWPIEHFCNVIGCGFSRWIWFLSGRRSLWLQFLGYFWCRFGLLHGSLPLWLYSWSAYMSVKILFACIGMNLWPCHAMDVIASIGALV